MPIESSRPAMSSAGGSLSTAPYLAKIVSHLDPSFQGGLEVSLLRESGNQMADETQTFVVRYASPFYGATAFEFSGKNLTFDDSQKSYGFWAVPPDVGVVGIVMFINGDPANGFWVACVQDKFINHMVPAIGASKHYQTVEKFEQGDHPLPVTEYNKKANQTGKNLEIDKIKRAVHPIAKRFREQGLIRDEFRGHTTSTTRRDVPNMVFGMSTPGPVDRLGKRAHVGNKQSYSAEPVPVSRLGGTQIVMDDGDDRYYRGTSPSKGGPNYVNIKDGGDKNFPYSEYFRIRTRTGHQLLFHNSEDLIYIANSRGTAWIELTSDGKIDIFANDSVSIRTKQDFNFYADRDVNIEAGRNVNIKAGSDLALETSKSINLVAGTDGKITVKNHLDIDAGGHIFQTSAGSNETKASKIIESAGQIHMNGPGASSAAKAKPLKTHGLPDLPKASAEEKPIVKTTIVRRMPTPEPYPHHENLAPTLFKPDRLDRDSQGRDTGTTNDLSKTPPDWKKYKKPPGHPF